jgi:plasmid stability protein
MASITLKDIPEDLHAVLKSEADANFRSLEHEVLARLQRSLDFDTATQRDQKWIDEAVASGPEEPFSEEKFAAALKRGLQKAKSRPA